MAQPSESSLSRPPEQQHLASTDLELQKHHQQHELLFKESRQSACPSDASTASGQSCTHPVGNGARHVSGGGDDEGASNGGSTAFATAHPNSRAPIVAPAEWLGEDAHITRQETRYDGDTPLLTSTPMSNAQPPHGPPRQQMGYPSPTAYPHAGLPPQAHYYQPQPAPQDPYRQAPTALPSMRTLDHVPSQQQQQPQPQHPQQHAMAMNVHMGGHMGPAPPMAYYAAPPHAYSIHPDPTAMRFAIPPGMADPRIALSGGRHKKCDEAHPTCNNCKKSKRECLGYDPIFKQQQQQGPATIQPAPSNQSSPAPATTLASTPTLPSSAPHPSYQSQPPVVPSSFPPSVPSSITYDSPASSTHSVKAESAFDYSSAIDPALQGADLSTDGGTPVPQYQSLKAEGLDDVLDGKHHSKGGTPSFFSISPSPGRGRSYAKELREAYENTPAKKMKVDELIALGGAAPTNQSTPQSADILSQITKIYQGIYVQGLSSFFETKWFESGDRQAGGPIAAIQNNSQLVTLFSSFIQTISSIKDGSSAEMAPANHLEERLVWTLSCLPTTFLPHNYQGLVNNTIPAEDDALEARHRVHVFETLVSGDTLTSNPLVPPAASALNPGRQSELEFWYHLAEYILATRSSRSPDHILAREQHLARLRANLEGQENRDVLYSIAVLREYTPSWDALSNEQVVNTHSKPLQESDPRNKLAVATRFIRNEGTPNGGTTNVARRLADIAYRSFVQPGVNVDMVSRKH
ncbi:hypothetical protein OQA88_10836 [Cercophora sp. LCS_1]